MKESKRRGAATADDVAVLLVDAIGQARDHARDLASARGYDRDLASALDLAWARARDVALASDLASDLVRDVALARYHASTLANSLSCELGGTLTVALASTFDRDHARAFVRDLALARGHASDLASDLALIGGLARRLLAADKPAGKTTPLARRLLAIAARLLPAAEQLRYGEEFGSELAEIVLAGGRRRTQLAYAVRQLLCVRQLRAELRAELRASRRRGAVQ